MPQKKVEWQKPSSTRIHKFEIEIEYVHNLKELYKRLYFWLDDNGWKDVWGASNYEVRYWQRDLPGGGMSEHHIWWRAWRHPGSLNYDQKLFKQFFKIDYQTIAASRKEVMHKGQKWKLDQSNTILRVESYLVIDWDKEWEKGLLGRMKEPFKQWLYKDKIVEQENAVFGATVELQNKIKDFLELTKDEEQEANIYPPNALP